MNVKEKYRKKKGINEMEMSVVEMKWYEWVNSGNDGMWGFMKRKNKLRYLRKRVEVVSWVS